MGRGREGHRKFARLPVRRTCLRIINTVSAAARWAVFEPGDKNLARRVRAQILTYFYYLHELGAFANDSFMVECDAGVSKRNENREHAITILLVFQPAACDESISLTLHLSATGCRVGSAAFAPSVEDSAR